MIVPTLVGPGNAWPVQIGAVWYSAWDLENALHKYCKQIFALTDDAQFPYCLPGSGAAVKFEGRHFLFCCRHQIRGFAPDKIAVPLSREKKIMNASSMRQLAVTDVNRDDDTIDVAAFEYNVEDYGVPNLISEFFPAEDARIWPTGSAQMPFMIFGYPSKRQLYDEAGIGAWSIEIKAAYDGGTSSPHLQRVVLEKPIDADGMSGGPVFYIGGTPGNYFVGFAGIVMRGGENSSYLHFMAAHFLFDMAFEASTLPWTQESDSSRLG